MTPGGTFMCRLMWCGSSLWPSLLITIYKRWCIINKLVFNIFPLEWSVNMRRWEVCSSLWVWASNCELLRSWNLIIKWKFNFSSNLRRCFVFLYLKGQGWIWWIFIANVGHSRVWTPQRRSWPEDSVILCHPHQYWSDDFFTLIY